MTSVIGTFVFHGDGGRGDLGPRRSGPSRAGGEGRRADRPSPGASKILHPLRFCARPLRYHTLTPWPSIGGGGTRPPASARGLHPSCIPDSNCIRCRPLRVGRWCLPGWLAFPNGGVTSPQASKASRLQLSGTIRAPPGRDHCGQRARLADGRPDRQRPATPTRGSAIRAATSTQLLNRSVTVFVNGATSTLTLSAPSSGKRAAKSTVSGKLTLSGRPLPPPWTLRVVAPGRCWQYHPAGDDHYCGRRVSVQRHTAGRRGQYLHRDLRRGQLRHRVEPVGHREHLAAATTPRLTTKADPKEWAPAVKVTAYLGKTYTNRKVCLYAKPHGEYETRSSAAR